MPFGPAHRKGVQSELMTEATDIAGQEPSPNQERPEVAHVVVHLMIVHFIFWAETEPECRKLEKPLASPGGHIKEA